MSRNAAPEILSREAVASWLQEWEPDAVVGFAADCAECPYATYLRSQGYTVAAVLSHCWDDAEVTHANPPLIEAWISGMDEAYAPACLPADIRRADQRPITAAEALAVLRSLELPKAVEV